MPLLLLAACAENAPVPGDLDARAADQGAVHQDASGADAGALPDAVVDLDAIAASDATPVDALAADASAEDASVGTDAGGPADAPGAPDAAEPDATPAADATSPDVGPPVDGGPVDRIYAQWPMPDSVTEYCANGTTPIACPAPGAAAYGQDGNSRAPLPTYTTTEDTVSDSITGLMWQRTGLPSARPWSDALAFCDALSLGGFDDWRLPTAIELTSLADLGDQNAELNAVTFPGFGASSFWSSTQYADYAPNKWAVDLGAGYRENRSIASQNSVVCVRAGHIAAGARYTISTDVATDNFTGLSWQRGASTATLSWLDALAYCQALALGGFSDWRLPSLKELNTIFDDARSAPAIDPTAFAGTPFADTDYFWSSSPHYYYDSAAWAVKYWFGTTHVFFTDSAQPATGRARCVR